MNGTQVAEAGIGSPLVAAIEQAWSSIRRAHEDVPEVVVTVGGGRIPGGLKLGHFAPGAWERSGEVVHELFVGGEGLERGARDVLATLIHEAAHAAAATRGVKDTSRQGRWHNARFREIAESFGLTITKDARIGWSVTKMPDETAERYAETIDALALAIIATRTGAGWIIGTKPGDEDDDANGNEGDDEAKKPKNGYSLTCECETPRRIRVSASTHQAGPITCGICRSDFTENE